MTENFKYIRLLRFAQLSYHLNDSGLFLEYYNGFLNEHKFKIPEDMKKSFENCMSYLDSISMVEKFLCAYFTYLEKHGLKINNVSGFNFYDPYELERLENRAITIRFKLTSRNYTSPSIMSIKINQDGNFYLSNPDDCSIARMFKKPENNKCYFINVNDIIYMHQQIYKDGVEKELINKEIKKIKSLVGKKIENSYRLPSYI